MGLYPIFCVKTPFRQQACIELQYLEDMMNRDGVDDINLRMLLEARCRAWLDVCNPENGYIAAGARAASLHPFKEYLHKPEELNIAKGIDMDMNQDDNDNDNGNGNENKNKKKTVTVHTIHVSGGFAHDEEILNHLRRKELEKELKKGTRGTQPQQKQPKSTGKKKKTRKSAGKKRKSNTNTNSRNRKKRRLK